MNSLLAPSTIQTVRQWANYNQCGELTTGDESTMDLVLAVPGLDTVVTRYPSCSLGGAVELWTMTGGPHRPSLTPNYSAAIVEWLLVHPKP